MLSLEEHGGGCCGMNHIFDFGSQPGQNDGYWADSKSKEEALNEKLKSLIEKMYPDWWESEEYFLSEIKDKRNSPEEIKIFKQRLKSLLKKKKSFNTLLEAVLTDEQMKQWASTLKKMGFKLVNRFFNSNSGNYCNVLHYTTHEPRGKNRKPAPYKW